ncbi:MAG TPA: 23S rRNA (guanosine(2251)-2'-O)-methyltransferase RlmB [Acidimicrobiales bacterium]|nr:23S rRNA (guanosine(2251)-2'-O)-methyltransferase RlmB [Acidimicrobiales bacterium]
MGGEQVEGRQAVAELLAARRRPVVDVWMAQDVSPAPVLERIEALAREARVALRRVSRSRLDAEAATDAPQGVLAHARPLPEAQLDDLARPAASPTQGAARAQAPFLLAVDGVTDPHNLGAMLRSAEAAGATGAILGRHRAVHVTPTVAKAAAGAIEHVPMAVVPGLPAALARAKELGCWVVGLAEDGDRSLFDDLPVATEPIVVVVGSEGAGLSRLARARCDLVLNIPMRGRLPSLNVSAAAALALFEVSRRR